MFILSFKASRKTFFASFVGLLILIAVLAAAFWPNSADNADETGRALINAAGNNDQRVVFLKQFGWEIDTNSFEVEEVRIPEVFEEVYNNYNEIQKKQGYDLTKHAGKRVKRYTYAVLNYPNGINGVRANLLVYKNKVIGGDICSVALDGFMHGFDVPDLE